MHSGGADWADPSSHTTTSTPCPSYTGPCSPIGAWPNIGYYFISQTYTSDNPFTSLDGADLNDDGISHRKEGGLKINFKYEAHEKGCYKVYAELV